MFSYFFLWFKIIQEQVIGSVALFTLALLPVELTVFLLVCTMCQLHVFCMCAFMLLLNCNAVLCLLTRSANLLNIERVLLIAERYIISVEELHTAARSILPHGASFQGLPLNFTAICDALKKEFPIQVIQYRYYMAKR